MWGCFLLSTLSQPRSYTCSHGLGVRSLLEAPGSFSLRLFPLPIVPFSYAAWQRGTDSCRPCSKASACMPGSPHSSSVMELRAQGIHHPGQTLVHCAVPPKIENGEKRLDTGENTRVWLAEKKVEIKVLSKDFLPTVFMMLLSVLHLI